MMNKEKFLDAAVVTIAPFCGLNRGVRQPDVLETWMPMHNHPASSHLPSPLPIISNRSVALVFTLLTSVSHIVIVALLLTSCVPREASPARTPAAWVPDSERTGVRKNHAFANKDTWICPEKVVAGPEGCTGGVQVVKNEKIRLEEEPKLTDGFYETWFSGPVVEISPGRTQTGIVRAYIPAAFVSERLDTTDYDAASAAMLAKVPDDSDLRGSDYNLQSLLSNWKQLAGKRASVKLHAQLVTGRKLEPSPGPEADRVRILALIAPTRTSADLVSPIAFELQGPEIVARHRAGEFHLECSGGHCDEATMIVRVAPKPLHAVDEQGRSYMIPLMIVEDYADRSWSWKAKP